MLSHDCSIQKLAATIRKLLLNQATYQNILLQYNRNRKRFLRKTRKI